MARRCWRWLAPVTDPGDVAGVRWQIPPRIQDTLLVSVLLAADVVTFNPEERYPSVPFAVDVLLVVLQTLPLAFRRRWPGTVLAVMVAALGARLLLHSHMSIALLGLFVAIYAVGAYGSERTRVAAAAVTAVAFAVGLAELAFAASLLGEVVFLAPGVLFGAALVGGDNMRTRRKYLGMLEARARSLAADRERQAEQAVAAERAKIAREVHDLVAHHLSAIAVQARAASGSAGQHPGRAENALRAITAASDQALAEMRQLLGMLRDAHARAEDRPEAPALTPPPTLADIGQLLSEHRALGQPLQVTVTGRPRGVPELVSLSAYRIVQEALTNVRRHAPGADTMVAIGYGERELEIQVQDEGRPGVRPATDSGGYGLAGMRERAALLGGELTAGPTPEGGFAVYARLPAGHS